MQRRRLNALSPTLGLLALLWLGSSWAAPKADLWSFWSAYDEQSDRVVDHGAWTALLTQYVRANDSGANRFDYGGVTPGDAERLNQYIDALAELDPRELNRAEQKAYWINLYNAITVQQILRAYPVESIRDIKSGLFSAGPWKKELVNIAGQTLTLNDIEHRILRPVWNDPLIHYGVNCASIGCPDLRTTAYTGAEVDAQLAENAQAYVNDPRGAKFADGELSVSSIYIWFQADFGGSDAGVLMHLRRYANDGLRRRLSEINAVDDDHYDWSLNDLAPGAS